MRVFMVYFFVIYERRRAKTLALIASGGNACFMYHLSSKPPHIALLLNERSRSAEQPVLRSLNKIFRRHRRHRGLSTYDIQRLQHYNNELTKFSRSILYATRGVQHFVDVKHASLLSVYWIEVIEQAVDCSLE